MLTNLATFIHGSGRRILFAAVIGAAIAGVFGIGVTRKLSPTASRTPRPNRSRRRTGSRRRPAGRSTLGSSRWWAPATFEPPRRSPLRRERAARRAGHRGVAATTRPTTRDGLARPPLDVRSRVLQAALRHATKERRKDDRGPVRRPARRAARRAGADERPGEHPGRHDLAHAELLAFPFIFLLSLLFFRSLVASLIPPLLGGVAIVVTFFALRIVSSFTDLSVFALNFVTGLGLGLAIDYSLFMVSRYREEAAVSGFGAEPSPHASDLGRTILFSSVTVAAALASLAIFPQRFLYSMGVAGAIVAFVAATLALVVLPALLAVLGPRVNALAPKRLQRAADRDARPARKRSLVPAVASGDKATGADRDRSATS